MSRKMKIMVGTPTYNGQLYVDYVRSLLDLTANGISYSWHVVIADSLVARARNTILTEFHQRTDLTHLLYLDADVGIRGRDVRRLLEHGKDVIGAPIRLKIQGAEKPVFSVGEVLSRTGTLARVTRIGTGVLMLSRNAVDKLIEHAIENERSYAVDPLTVGDVPSGMHYDVFRQGASDGNYVSEDYQVCHTLRLLGFDVFADLGIRTKHFGIYEFSG
jgi:hypothetical protein